MAQFFNFQGDYLGLTDSEAERSVELYGLNTYTNEEKKKECFSEGSVIFSPPAIMLFIAAVLSFFGEGFGVGIAVLLIDIAYCAAEIYLGKASDRRIADIQKSAEIRFRVIRNGKMELVDKEHVLTDDLLVVQAGERVPADAFIRESRDLTVDEYVLSSSHQAIAKNSGSAKKSALNESFVYSGTTVLSGIAVCEVTAIGVDTKLYHKYGNVPDSHPYYTDLEMVIRRTIPLCAIVACALALISMISWAFAYREIIASVLRGLTLGLCFFPTGLSTLLRLYYTRCASDMLSGMAVIKSLNDVEKLNSLSVLCVEKSGVIAKENMEVRGIYTDSEELLYNVAVLSCEQNTQDPTEKALLLKATFFDEQIYEVCEKNQRIEKLPNGDENLNGALWSLDGTKLYCIRGIPEKVFPLCHMKPEELFAAKKKLSEYYEQGCRVIALACADATEDARDSTVGFRYTFVGLAAFSAPLRENVAAAVKTCRRSGVKVVMFSDDNESAAAATGRMIGLSGAKAVSGKDVASAMRSGAAIDPKTEVYTQLSEEQKLYVMSEMKRSGEVVAMAATRADDAMLLEQADIGITMSQYTSGSAYESADIIMNDDTFSSIANTIACARQTHRNIKKAVGTFLSGYVSLLVINLVNIFGGAKLMLNPPLAALITMVLIPAAALLFFGSRTDMRTLMPPSAFVTDRRINLPFVIDTAVCGALCGIVAVASYSFMYSASNSDFARSCALISIAFCAAGFCCIRVSKNNPFSGLFSNGAVSLACLGVQIILPIALVYIPAVNHAFGLLAIDMLALFISVATGLLPPVIYYVIKRFLRTK